MSAAPPRLDGERVAVIVEHKFIPEEIELYRTEFAALGAEVEFVSQIYWGDYRPGHPHWKTPVFYGDVDPIDGDPLADPVPLEVHRDVSEVDLSGYAALVMSANYTSVRLRWAGDPLDEQAYPEPFHPRAYLRRAPLVRLFADAMADPRIVKGALCHGLWILTPNAELLEGRRVICHAVVMADVVNCGAAIVRTPDRVVVDGDLVTGYSKQETKDFIHAIAAQVVARRG
ncbi:MAG TPA: DJ-1/PfpI family protein [Longimicrobiaceae bacterium]|nr:DJ-1/PfpI family protein [Longimicrobiaceae bacterium]